MGACPVRAQSAPTETDWLHYANDLASTRYSPLNQIHAGNFDKLELAWRFSTNALGQRLDADFMATPLVVKGRIYTTAGFRRDVVCLDAGTGEELWLHRHDEGARIGSRGGTGLGVGYWTDGRNERIVYVTRGYSMFSLDAKTGLPDPAFGTSGMVDLRLNDDQVMDPNRGIIGLHAPPLVVKDTIVVGSAPTLDSKGYVRGFDIKTGQRKWIFHTIPRKGEAGYETWTTPGQAEAAGNTGVWGSMSADPELGLVYVPVELPQADTLGTTRTGANLFGETLVALDIETGARKWHYQMIHHGLQDRDIPCAGIICDIPHNGKTVKAIAQPSKQGWIYLLDRTTGKPVFPIPEKPIPKGDVPGETYWPTEPMPSAPPPFAMQGDHRGLDLVDFTPGDQGAGAGDRQALLQDGAAVRPARHHHTTPVFGALDLCRGCRAGRTGRAGRSIRTTNVLYIYAENQLGVTDVTIKDGKPAVGQHTGGRQPRSQWRRAGGIANLKGTAAKIPSCAASRATASTSPITGALYPSAAFR